MTALTKTSTNGTSDYPADERKPDAEPAGLTFAAVGDVHGHHHQMVALVEQAASLAGVTVELVLQVGDFEAHRHEDDVATMCAPARYRKLGDFHEFHSGRARFPWPVLHIGGNHEPYGFYETMPHGGETAPGCHYLGRAGVWEHRGLRVAGLSGIYRPDQFDCHRPHVSTIDSTSNKLFIGYRREHLGWLLDACQDAPPHVLLLHEWPYLVMGPTDLAQMDTFMARLAPAKPGSPESEDHGFNRLRGQEALGSEEARELVQLIQPALLLCGHVHVPMRTWIHAPDGPVPMHALAKINAGLDSVALYHWRSGAPPVELEGWRPLE